VRMGNVAGFAAIGYCLDTDLRLAVFAAHTEQQGMRGASIKTAVQRGET
jgi:hypothetical protein